ncbi:hypothetical protein M406DRAFT_344313 [Cryphonectria parasitica EP155]|uniref:Mmc1 C-terminal domain-containing protein n=1 Tax=Cryphonectria parasitica (strain ATCC 38755 / EP155) TaxID=660469 RepID=A0A9P4YCB7_CRYP1|nr:uncharacterized protein M406DRAFT_344313 [Cryphonectria parasitica EP155]KAF3770746.1 hypothetical protein M406DRAFT_344313 [Cryphonectria parasitica EP155]
MSLTTYYVHHYDRSTSTTASTSTSVRTSDARKDLQEALRSLQKHAVNYVNLSRVQLALNALRQEAGDETVRVAILGLANGSDSGPTAKEILRLLLADPLSPQQEWEGELLGHDINKPLIVRVGAAQHLEQGSDTEEGNLTYAKGGLLKELNVSSPGLDGNRLEFLLMTSNPLADASEFAVQRFEEAALVPTVEIPTSSTGRFTPVTTPVHKALLVGDGLMGAASLINSPVLHHDEAIMGAVNLPGFVAQDEAGLPFIRVDVTAAEQGVHDIRQSVDKAFGYEKLWFKSNMPAIIKWLKEGATTTDNSTTKSVVRNLIASVLRSTRDAIGQEEVRRLSAASSSIVSPRAVVSLNNALADWSEKAHAELQGELDRAFSSRRWSKLNWWKLFWRVDDVGVLSSEMLSQRFLPRAERNVIYLAGQIDGSELLGPDNGKAVYSLPSLVSAPLPTSPPSDSTTIAQATPPSLPTGTKWPTHITFTRNYLQLETIPALQALAQKLVFQSASFSGLTTALGALMYLSSFGLSESGAVAAFGIVWSLRRLQKKWEAAREYWQSEVREEGRKAVRAVEISVGEALDKATRKGGEGVDEAHLKDLRAATELIQKAEEALERLQ